MATQILKNTRIHAVVLVTGTGPDTITLANLELASQDITGQTPRVNISGIRWSVPAVDGLAVDGIATVVRNSVVLANLSFSGEWRFDGFSIGIENDQDIVVMPDGGTVILELKKVSGFGDTQHINPDPDEVIG